MSHNYALKTIPLALIALLLLSPFGAFAKENGKGKSEAKRAEKAEHMEKREKQEKKERSSCVKAFGHLIAPGWLRVKANLEGDVHCELPFGIGKKFGGQGTSTSSADIAAPVISGIVANAELTDAVISWKTDERTKGTIFYGTSASINVNSASTLRVDEKRFFSGREHEVAVRGLAASTTYYAIVRAEDKAGNASVSSVFSFTTKSPVAAGDTVAPAILDVATVAGAGSVGIGWRTNEPATSKVFYSAGTPVSVSATATASVGVSDLTSIHFVLIPGLSASTTYYFVAESKDAAGNTNVTSEFSATTAR